MKLSFKEKCGLARKNADCYLFVLPYMLIFFVFTVLPVLLSMLISFTDFNMIKFPNFVGADNYVRMLFKDDLFMTALKNTLIFALVTGPISYLMCFGFAWLINENSPKMRAVLTLLFYAPTLSGNMALIWDLIFMGDRYGVLNSLLLKVGLISEPILWLKDTSTMVPVLIVIILWQSLGTSFLTFIAGFQCVDKTQYEAAAVDGVKNRWQELWYITLPNMKPQLMFGAVLSISSAFGVGDIITTLVGYPSTDYAAHTIVHHLQDYGNLRYEMGYASAIATVLFLLMIFTNKLVQKILSKVGS